MYPFDLPLSPFSDQQSTPEQQWAQDQEIGIASNQPLVSRQPATPPSTPNPLGNLGFAALDALGFLNQQTDQPSQKQAFRRLQQVNNTDAQNPYTPSNPFGNYTPNAGLGNNFQPTKGTATQRWGYAEGGQAEGPPNKTQRYLQGIQPEQPGQQEFWGQAIMDIDHPLEQGKKLTYQQLQQLVRGPQRKQILDGYAQQQRMQRSPSAEEYLQHQFDQGRTRLYQRAEQVPDAYAFPEQADQARQAVLRPLAERASQQLQPTVPGQVTNPQIRAQYYAGLTPDPSGYIAPGMGQARKFAEGGEYQLTDWQIEELRAQGYQVEER